MRGIIIGLMRFRGVEGRRAAQGKLKWDEFENYNFGQERERNWKYQGNKMIRRKRYQEHAQGGRKEGRKERKKEEYNEREVKEEEEKENRWM